MSLPKCLTNPGLIAVKGGTLERDPTTGLKVYRLMSKGKSYGLIHATAARKWFACPVDGRREVLCDTRGSAVDYLLGRAKAEA
jgi:hypothetical protein